MNNSRRGVLAAGLALIITACTKKVPDKPAVKPAAKKEPTTKPPEPDTIKLALVTSKGEIVLELEAKKAPITTANFLHYADTHKFDGATIWRALKVDNTRGFIQGAALNPPYPPIAHEPTTQTGLSHTDGVISMPRYGLGTAASDFTISVGDMTYLDAGGTGSEDKQGYAAFGHVIKGMDVVHAILNGRIDKKRHEDGLEGQMLAEPVVILSAHRID
ncbi:MAG: peptidylprolyl isomerase [Asticcacaulis sp.]